MRIPFTAAQFFDVFRAYNEAVWPMQLLLLAAALAAVALAFSARPRAAQGVSGILAALWLWMGAVYHILFFREINSAAALFGALFIGQGALFAWVAWSARLHFEVGRDVRGVAGAALIGYALLVYPILGFVGGRVYPAAPTFGLPCPTTIFTLGLMLWARAPVPRLILVVPLLWAVVGTSAALQLGVPEDFGLLGAGILAMSILRPRRRQARMA